MLGICKANSYGHGAVRVAQRLQQAGCHWVAVNCYDEAEELRAAGVGMEILILGPQPANIAVDVANLLVANGVKAIWNFAHVDLDDIDGLVVENVHLSDSLMQLSYNIANHNK